MPPRPTVSAVAALLVLAGCGDAPRASAQASTSVQSPRTVNAAVDASRRTALVAAVERASGAVVSINASSQRRPRAGSPWDLFFVPERSRLVEGYGTGFVIRPSGVILTN